jgi:hypothetical protein
MTRGGGRGRSRSPPGLTATITLLHVLLDVPDGAGITLWWLFAAVSLVLTVWLVVGLTRASQDHPIS